MKFDQIYRQFKADPESVDLRQFIVVAEREDRLDDINRIIEKLRDQIAEDIDSLADYEHYFEGIYEDSDGWDIEGDVYRRTIYFSNPLDLAEDTVKGQIIVAFEEKTPRVEGITFRDPWGDVYHGDPLWSNLAKEWMA